MKLIHISLQNQITYLGFGVVGLFVKNVVITLTFEIIVGDCSFESGFPSSWLPDLTLFTLNRPFLVKEFVFGVLELADIMLAAIILFSVEILNLPFLVKEFELNSAELPIFPIDEPYGLQKENLYVCMYKIESK